MRMGIKLRIHAENNRDSRVNIHNYPTNYTIYMTVSVIDTKWAPAAESAIEAPSVCPNR